MKAFSSMASLPREIWLHIAHFLHPSQFQELLSLNRIVFDLVMDFRYKIISFSYLDKKMVRNLTRLKDPSVARRVRILYIYPKFIDEAMSNESDPSIRHSFLARLMELGSLYLEHKLFTKVKKFSIVRMLQRTDDVVKIMLHVLGGLPNVTDYYVTWSGLPSITAASVPFLSVLFRANLRKLSLELSLENVRIILSSSFQIENLEELHLRIRANDVINLHDQHLILSSHLAPAINNLHPSLRALSVEAKEGTDLSPLFLALRHLPALQDLSLSVPPESPYLGDPDGFASFLNRNQANLQILRLRVGQLSRTDTPPDELSFESWITEALCTASLPKLRMLEIASLHFPPAAAEACVRRFGGSIQTLTVTGYHRPYDRVQDLLDIISSCQGDLSGQALPLERLRLGVDYVSPQLVSLFASKLPNLQRLELLAKYLVPHPSQRVQPAPHFGQKFTQVDDFLEEMQEIILPCWQLRHLSLIAEHLPIPDVYRPILEEIFLHAIPSLKSFA